MSVTELRLFNTLGRQMEVFKSLRHNEVGLYCCGPTVYLDQHVGNMRTYLFQDVLRRILRELGYSVTHVLNITDVGHLTDDADTGEDKMIKSAREKGQSVWDIAASYTEQFFADIDALNILRPTIVCKATDHIQDMIDLVQRLSARGHTYQAGGNVFYDIATFPDYGKLALLDRQQLQAGARVEIDRHKRHANDFGLWFTNSKFERQTMVWDSPWGRGYPGWHIECSAMSMKYLGDRFDIHCGGVDHIPVHHTNEIAQAEGATGKSWVNYWLHGEFLVVDKRKMAKSSGNLLTIGDLRGEGFEPLDFRYFVLGAHYRSQQNFTLEALHAARSARLNLMDRFAALAQQTAGELSGVATPGLREFQQEVANDLHMPGALRAMWGVVKDDDLSPIERVSTLLAMDRILGLRLDGAQPQDHPEALEPDLARLLQERDAARRLQDWSLADELRGVLLEQGIAVEDTADGSRWKRVRK